MAMYDSTRFAPAKYHDPVCLQQPQHPQHPSLSLPVEHASPNPRLPNLDPPSRTTQPTHRSCLLLSDHPFSAEHERAVKQSPQSSPHRILRPPQDPRIIASHPGLVSDILSVEGAIPMPQAQRLSISSVGTQSLGHGYESLGTSDAWSPTSARNQGPNHSDDQFQNPLSDHLGGKHDRRGESSKIVEDEPPSWSELKTKAGKERKRLPLACIACRRKKTRCSGEKPACKHCSRSRVSCIYKVTARKPTPRTDYMAMLDKRLKRMEERVITNMPGENFSAGPRPGRPVVRSALPVLTSDPGPTRKKRATDQAFTGGFRDSARSSLQPVADESTRSASVEDGEKTLLTEGAEFLPTKELQEHLAEVFFDCVYGQSCLLLHKPSFMRNLGAGSVPPVLVLAVCAISARFSTHPLVDTEPAFLRGEMWATPAREIAERRHGEPSFTILTVMAILSLHYFGTCEGGLSWSFSGQALRMALALRLYEIDRDPDPSGWKTEEGLELSFTDREIRRRAMWTIFLIDRFSASGAETLPLEIEQDLRIQLPVKESHFQMEIPGPTEHLEGNVSTSTTLGPGPPIDPKENMGVEAYIIRAVVLWGRITKYLRRGGKHNDSQPIWSPDSGFARLRGEIDSFCQSMPSSLIYTAENLQIHAAERIANQFLLLHVICQQNILFLYRFAIPVSPDARPPKEMPTQFLKEASRCAVEAASQISHLIRDAVGYPLTAPFVGYCAYVASLVHIWGMFSGDPQLEATSKENLKYSYRWISKMKDYWGLYHRTVEQIKGVYRLFTDARSSGATSTTEPRDPCSGSIQREQVYGKNLVKVMWNESAVSSKLPQRESGFQPVMSHESGPQCVEEFFASLLPPSKVASTRKLARRRKREVSDIKVSPPPQIFPPANPHSSHQQHHQHQQNCAPEPCPPALHHQTLAPCQTVPLTGFINNTTTTPGYMSDPPQQLYQSHNFNVSPFYTANSLPSLDHQLPFKACTGIDETDDADLSSGTYSTWQGQYMEPTFGNLGCEMDGDVSGFMQGHVPSSAWFVPFNVHPPQGGDVHAGLFMAAAAGDGGGGGGGRGGGGGGGGRPYSQQVLGNEGMTGEHGQTC